MKRLLTILLVLTTAGATAQEFTFVPEGPVSDLTIVVQNLYSDLVIEGGQSSEIRIQAHDYEGLPDKARGLRPLSAQGPDNTQLGLHISQDGKTIRISGASRKTDDSDYRITLPAAARLEVNYGNFQADDLTIIGMAGEIEVRTQVGDLEFIDVTGPIVASTMSGDIDVIFTSLNQSSPTAISSVSGDIDITLPDSTKGMFSMNTVSGEVYTDLDFEVLTENQYGRSADGEARNRRSRQNWGFPQGFPGFPGMATQARLNGGGVDITLRSVSGDIFIRRASQ